MSIINYKQQFLDQGYVVPQVSGSVEEVGQVRLNQLYVNNSLAEIIVAGFLNTVSGNGGLLVLPQDFWFIYYSGGSGLFVPSIDSNGIVTLNPVSSSGVNQLSVPITAAQFNGMYAAPKLLIPAPGANNLIVLDSMDLVLTYNSAAYAAGGPVAAQYDSTVDGAGVLASNSEAAADFFITASTTFQFNRISGNTVGALPFSTTVNKGLYLSNTTAPFTTGNSPLVAVINYHVIQVA